MTDETEQSTNGENADVLTTEATDNGTTKQDVAAELTQEQQQQNDVDAFTKGVESLKGETTTTDATPKKEDPAATDAGKPGERPATKQPAADAAAEAAKQAKQPDPELEKEIGSLGLKGKSAERFREMAGEIKTARPMMDTLKGLNVADPGTLNSMLKDVAVGLQWEAAVQQSTATPEQLKSALGIIQAMNANDPKLKGAALDAMLGECKNVAEALGREIPGLTGDVLDKHADLKDAVEKMDITREYALELAKQRATNGAYVNRDQQNYANAQRQQQEQQAVQRERADIDALAETLQKNDPHYEAKFDAMRQQGVFARIGQLPIGQKYAALLQAYNAMPAPVAAPAPAPAATRVRPTQVTNRGNNTSAAGVARREFANDVEAFEFGVASVSPHQ